MKRTMILLVLAVLLYGLSWLLPVVDGGTALSEGGLPGWEAFRLALSPIWSYEGLAGNDLWSDVPSVLSALTNIAFVGAAVVLASSPHRLRSAANWVLVPSAVLNALWFVLSGERGDLRIGYYLWLTSFLVLAVAARAVPADAVRDTAPPAAA